MYSYPHPVLGNGDDLRGRFEFESTASIGKEVALDGRFVLDNERLEELLADGSAMEIVRIECPKSLFRKTFDSSNGVLQVSIPTSDLVGNVCVLPVLVASKELAGYAPSGANPDYQGAKFDVAQGQLLAVGDEQRFDVDTSFDPLKSKASSIMSIGQREQGENMKVDYYTDKIQIWLSEGDWAGYRLARDRFRNSVHSSIVFPVLLEALRILDSDRESFEHCSWFQRVELMMDRLDLPDDTDPLMKAQRLLKAPVGRALSEFQRYFEDDIE